GGMEPGMAAPGQQRPGMAGMSRPDAAGGPSGVPGVRTPAGLSPDNPMGSMTSEMTVPEQGLLRFIDVLVGPGYTYQYQVNVRTLNPTSQRKKDVAYAALAKPEKLEAKEWTPTPPVTVPVEPDSQFYVVDEKNERGQAMMPPADKDRLPVQIHRWITQLET